MAAESTPYSSGIPAARPEREDERQDNRASTSPGREVDQLNDSGASPSPPCAEKPRMKKSEDGAESTLTPSATVAPEEEVDED